MLNMWQSTMYSSMVPFFLRWNHERAYRTLVLRWVPSEGWPGVGLQWKQQVGTGKLNVFFKPILWKCVCSNFEIHNILYHLKIIVCLASIRGKTWPWGAGHFRTLEVSTCQMPCYVPAGGGGWGGGCGGLHWLVHNHGRFHQGLQTTGRPPSVSGGHCWLKPEQWSFVFYRKNTHEQNSGYNLS